jgi:transposase/uncharacterized small protein (DUF1192 family)
MSQSAPLPTTVAELQALVLEQQASIENMVREIAARDDEIERLKAQIDKLRRMYFGSKSEKLARQIDKLEAQLEDLTAGQGAAETRGHRDKTSTAPPGRTPTREPLPPHLPRDEIELTPNAACPKCSTTMQRLGEDVSEQLARVAAAFKVIRTIRHKLCCPDCGHIEQPAMPSLPIEHSIAHPSLLADIAVSGQYGPLDRADRRALRTAC